MTSDPLPTLINIGDKYRPAMAILDQGEADAYFERCVAHTMGFGTTREDAERIERSNLGYFAGYYDDTTRLRVERLFHCAHPIFGAIAEHGAPSAAEALAKGFAMGQAAMGQAARRKVQS
jgi:hypothetical protein